MSRGLMGDGAPRARPYSQRSRWLQTQPVESPSAPALPFKPLFFSTAFTLSYRPDTVPPPRPMRSVLRRPRFARYLGESGAGFFRRVFLPDVVHSCQTPPGESSRLMRSVFFFFCPSNRLRSFLSPLKMLLSMYIFS